MTSLVNEMTSFGQVQEKGAKTIAKCGAWLQSIRACVPTQAEVVVRLPRALYLQKFNFFQVFWALGFLDFLKIRVASQR